MEAAGPIVSIQGSYEGSWSHCIQTGKCWGQLVPLYPYREVLGGHLVTLYPYREGVETTSHIVSIQGGCGGGWSHYIHTGKCWKQQVTLYPYREVLEAAGHIVSQSRNRTFSSLSYFYLVWDPSPWTVGATHTKRGSSPLNEPNLETLSQILPEACPQDDSRFCQVDN